MKACLYCRVSTDEQAEYGHSIQEQEHVLVEYAKNRGYAYEVFIDDGYSAKNLNRPHFKRFMERAEEFDVFIVKKLDRLSRSLRDILNLVDGDFLEKGIEFASVTEQIDTTTSTGRFMLNNLGAVAQFQRETIIDNTKAGLKQRARKGLHTRVPVGYYVDNGKVMVDTAKAEIIKELFEMSSNGASARELGKVIAQLGKKQSEVYRILKRRFYCGYVTNNGEEFQGQHEAIISESLYFQANSTRRAFSSRLVDDSARFRKIVRCGACGQVMITKTRRYKGQVYFYYECQSVSAKVRGETVICSQPTTYADKRLFNKVLDYFDTITFNVDEKERKQSNQLQRRLSYLEKQQEGLKARKKRVLDMFELDSITMSEVQKRLKEIESTAKQYQEEVDQLHKQSANTQLIHALYNARKILTSATIQEQAKIIHALIQSITVYKDRTIKVQFYFG